MPKPTISIIFYSGIVLLIFSSCRDNKKAETDLIAAMENSLQTSDLSINMSTATQLKTLENKKAEPCSKERAEKWFTVAVSITEKSKKFYDLLSGLKIHQQLNNEALAQITESLHAYKEHVLSVDKRIREEFSNNFDFINKTVSLLGGDTAQVNGGFSRNSSTTPYYSVLTLIQNEVKKIENRVIRFCNMQVGDCAWDFESYSVIVAPNSNYLKPGSTLTITAGMGVFSKESDPTIKVYGQLVPLEPEGFALYKGKTPTKPGNYSVPVEITYTNKYTGHNETRTIQVEYTVAKPCDQ